LNKKEELFARLNFPVSVGGEFTFKGIFHFADTYSGQVRITPLILAGYLPSAG